MGLKSSLADVCSIRYHDATAAAAATSMHEHTGTGIRLQAVSYHSDRGRAYDTGGGCRGRRANCYGGGRNILRRSTLFIYLDWCIETAYCFTWYDSAHTHCCSATAVSGVLACLHRVVCTSIRYWYNTIRSALSRRELNKLCTSLGF